MKWQGDEYDAILLGGGLGGLITGACLSKENRRVLLLKENVYHSSSRQKGYRFVPFSNFSEIRIKVPLLKRISEELGLPSFEGNGGKTRRNETRLRKPQETVDFQVILPQARIDLFCRRSMLEGELKREFPEEIAEIRGFYGEMDALRPLLKAEEAKDGSGSIFPVQAPSRVRRWWPFKPLPRGEMSERLIPLSREFMEFIRLQWVSWGNFFPHRFPISLGSHLLARDGTEEWNPPIDVDNLKDKILEKFLQTGGEVEEIGRVERVERKWRKGITLSLEGDERAFRSQCLILNSPLQPLLRLIDNRGKFLSRWGGGIQPQYALIPLFLGISDKVVPVGMRDLLVSLLDLKKPYEGGNLLFLNLSRRGDEAAAPDGRRALTVESLMIPQEWNSDSLIEQQKAVMKHLCHLFPFLEEHIEFMDWNWLNEHSSCWSYPHFLYETSSDFEWREGVVPNRLSRNVYFVGKENFPYLGMEGEVLGGLLVAKRILERSSKHFH